MEMVTQSEKENDSPTTKHRKIKLNFLKEITMNILSGSPLLARVENKRTISEKEHINSLSKLSRKNQ